MPIDITPFRVAPGTAVDLDRCPTAIPALYDSKDEYAEHLDRRIRRMRKLQAKLYADDRHALLLIFQAMDAAGKDGAIKHVMSGINPQGCQVSSFKQPSREELDHDFLWRTTVRLPERGRIGIFNRSYYEEVLVVRVHPEHLASQRLGRLPDDLGELWQSRYRSIVEHERHLHASGTRILKFFLHLSPGEQRRRFLARIDDPEKHWKFNAADVEERRHWPAYQQAYVDAIAATSTADAPWFVVPADDKKTARLLISEAIVSALSALDLRFPEPTEAEHAEMAAARAALEAEAAH
jgi:PPK2 family polyphosphate:nucleotide phosphotransferase